MKTLITILLGLTIISFKTTSTKNEHHKLKVAQVSTPDYQVGIQFINEYLYYRNEQKSNTGLVEWIDNRTDVTSQFKNELYRILNEAEKTILTTVWDLTQYSMLKTGHISLKSMKLKMST